MKSNTCIACNQACLDNIFSRKTASCLVNPRACNETLLPFETAGVKKKVAVVGAGPAGLSCAVTAAARGHAVTLFEGTEEIGGQFRLARMIPGKDEFSETMRYYRRQLELCKVELKMNLRATANDLVIFDEIVVAAGVVPRKIALSGGNNANVFSYDEVISGKKEVGRRVAIIGAGGIGFDMAAYLLHETGEEEGVESFMSEWGVDTAYKEAGGLKKTEKNTPQREIHLLQRKSSKPGAGLGKTTGWIHRSILKKNNVRLWAGVEYLGITDEGLGIKHGGENLLLEVDNVIICAGQESELSLADELKKIDVNFHLIGGALKAGELDAQRAIRQGVELADTL